MLQLRRGYGAPAEGPVSDDNMKEQACIVIWVNSVGVTRDNIMMTGYATAWSSSVSIALESDAMYSFQLNASWGSPAVPE